MSAHEEIATSDLAATGASAEPAPTDPPAAPAATAVGPGSAHDHGALPADPATVPEPPGHDPVAAFAAALGSRLDALGARLEDAVIQRQGFDRLYDDFDRCRKQESLALVLPWINGLIRLHDNIGKTRDALAGADVAAAGADPAERDSAARNLAERHLAGVQEDLEVLLENNGVALYRERDEHFNSRRQSVISLVPTAAAEQDGRIAAHVRPGFELGERLLRKERVHVYKHRPAAPDDPLSAPAATPEHGTG